MTCRIFKLRRRHFHFLQPLQARRPRATNAGCAASAGQSITNHDIAPPLFQNGATSGFEMCLLPSVRFCILMKKFKPHFICDCDRFFFQAVSVPSARNEMLLQLNANSQALRIGKCKLIMGQAGGPGGANQAGATCTDHDRKNLRPPQMLSVQHDPLRRLRRHRRATTAGCPRQNRGNPPSSRPGCRAQQFPQLKLQPACLRPAV